VVPPDRVTHVRVRCRSFTGDLRGGQAEVLFTQNLSSNDFLSLDCQSNQSIYCRGCTRVYVTLRQGTRTRPAVAWDRVAPSRFLVVG